MAWPPQSKANVFDVAPLADNLLGYIESNQTDALAWANGGSGLADFAKFYTNASGRMQTTFPSLLILGQRIESDLEEAMQADWQLVLEGAISGPNTDQIVADAKRYGQALESMLANIPSSTLTATCNPATRAYIVRLDTTYDEVDRLKSSAWIQEFKIRATYKLSANSF